MASVPRPVDGEHFSTPPTRTTSCSPAPTARTACLNAFEEVAQASSNRWQGTPEIPTWEASFGARWVSFSVIPPIALPR